MAIAQLLTVLTEPAGRALLLAQLAGPASRTRALPVDRITNATVLAVTLFRTIAPIMLSIAWPITLDALPARCAQTFARITLTGGSIHALAPFATVLAVHIVRAGFLTAFALKSGNAQTRSINM